MARRPVESDRSASRSGFRDVAHVGKWPAPGADPPSTEFLHVRQPYASEAHFRQHYGLFRVQGSLRMGRNQRSWRLICGKVMAYSRQRYGLSHRYTGGGQVLDPKVGSPGSIWALEATTGDRKWDFPLHTGSHVRGVLADGGRRSFRIEPRPQFDRSGMRNQGAICGTTIRVQIE